MPTPWQAAHTGVAFPSARNSGPWAGWGLGLVRVVLLLGVLATWAMAIARYGGPDETGHVLRAASVADGQLLGPTVPGLVGGFRSVTVPAALATGDPRCFRHDQRIAATCAVAMPGVQGERRVATSAGTNPPWYYLAVGLPVRLLGDPSRVISYRLVAAAWCALALVLAVGRSRRARPLARMAPLLAVSPAMWFLFGVVNPNSLEIALALLAWVGVARLCDQVAPTSAEVLWVSVPTALGILVRPVAGLSAITIVATVIMLRRSQPPLGRRRWAALVGPGGFALVAALGWSAWSNVAVSDQRSASPLSFGHRLGEAIRGVSDTVRELAGSLGWAEFSVPWAVQILWWAAVACGGISAWHSGPRRWRAWLLIAGSVVLVPVVFEALLAGRVGFIWQGRYSIPTAVGLVIVGIGDGTSLVRHPRWTQRLALGATVAAVAAEVAALWVTLRRYTVGTNGSWLFHDQGWHPAVPPVVMIILNAVLLGAFGNLTAHDVER